MQEDQRAHRVIFCNNGEERLGELKLSLMLTRWARMVMRG
jgi:hypothetical protein